ncbi:ABC transporter substrate-binding protein [Catellatospora sp. KI3]|uniref:ABC transporter substrate-binding protein n=1 Tax=Catellatospora sp. KI3 TaxID=3041620 RepID=UPI0024822016|nr:ABC transporter substrate-binding protein [Catellatospora sp. KI3]MDI1461453.1 ABC transporter substrate-binding protein [Catellatospora sp. KI3]
MRIRRTLAALGCLTVLAAAAACSSEPQPSTDPAAKTLTIAISGPPTLDPYKANIDPNNISTVQLAYASLIRLNADRSFSPDLAESFGYTDKQNKIFQMKLRSGLTFADGTPLDAAAVVASLKYLLKVSPKAQTWTGTITDITAADAQTVVVTNSAPNPVMRQIFSQAVLSGSVISPKGLADPTALAKQTFGAGPYVLDAAQTVPNDHYTYLPNPKFWNKSAQYWQKVVVRVIPDTNARVQAIQSGQVDFVSLTSDAGPAVKATGLPYATAGIAVVGMELADRDGAVAPQLKDVRVRQALNYAIDRAAITKAIFGTFAVPTSQMAAPGFDGYSKELDDRYPYDPEKAKSLLAEAGFPNGFTLKVETQQGFGISIVAQAVVAQWKKIGVEVELTTDTQTAQWLTNVTSKKFPVMGFAYGNLPTYLTSLDFMLPRPGPFNPFASGDAKLSQLLTAAAAEPDQAKQTALFQQAAGQMIELAWLAPVIRLQGLAVTGPRIGGYEQTADYGLPNVTTLRPKG